MISTTVQSKRNIETHQVITMNLIPRIEVRVVEWTERNAAGYILAGTGDLLPAGGIVE